jgi:GntR family transcriptional regulator
MLNMPTSNSETAVQKMPGVALHRQLYLVLREQLLRGHWRAGSALPTEDALCAEFGVSRITVRRALGDLVAEGLLQRRHGLGTFVTDGVGSARPQASLTFLERLRKTTAETIVTVLKVERAAAPADIARQLHSKPDEELLHALRLRSTGPTPVMVTDAWVPSRLAAGVTAAALRKRALYEILLGKGVSFGRVIQEITAKGAEPAFARLLVVPTASPLLVMDRLIHDTDGHPVLYLRAYMSGERSRILMDVAGSDINTLSAGQMVHD